MRHVVNVMRPTGARGSRGQPEGKADTIIANWQCSITPLGGSESDEASGTMAQMTYQVEGYGDPSKPIMPKDFLMFGTRKLHVSTVEDVNMNGQHLILTCGEELQRG